MRILIANANRNIVGGAEKYLQALIPGLLGRGHEVAIAYEHPINPERETIDSPGLRISAWGLAELGLDAVIRSVEDWRPDAVYNNGLQISELEEAFLLSHPTVLFAHDYYGTCGTGYKCHRLPQVQPCERKFGPMCLVLHYPLRCGGLNPLTTLRLFRKQSQRHKGLPLYKAVLVASDHMYQEYSKHGLTPEQLRLVPLPVTDIPRSPAPRIRKVQAGQILLIGRLTNLKGGDYLIRAMAQATKRVGPLKLIVAGDGPEHQRLKDLAAQCNISAEFRGWISTAEKLTVMREADLLAVPSLWPEPFGLVGIEAGSLGLPSVGFAVGGIPDWLKSGHSGELAPGDPPTVEGLADAIVRALDDSAHYQKLCRGAWEIAGRFTLPAHLDGLEAVLGERCHTLNLCGSQAT